MIQQVGVIGLLLVDGLVAFEGGGPVALAESLVGLPGQSLHLRLQRLAGLDALHHPVRVAGVAAAGGLDLLEQRQGLGQLALVVEVGRPLEFAEVGVRLRRGGGSRRRRRLLGELLVDLGQITVQVVELRQLLDRAESQRFLEVVLGQLILAHVMIRHAKIKIRNVRSPHHPVELRVGIGLPLLGDGDFQKFDAFLVIAVLDLLDTVEVVQVPFPVELGPAEGGYRPQDDTDDDQRVRPGHGVLHSPTACYNYSSFRHSRQPLFTFWRGHEPSPHLACGTRRARRLHRGMLRKRPDYR